MSDDMEVRCAALRMEYQKRMVHSNFIGIILIFCVFCIKTKDEHQLLMLLSISLSNPDTARMLAHSL
jgi:hypothetical protein